MKIVKFIEIMSNLWDNFLAKNTTFNGEKYDN